MAIKVTPNVAMRSDEVLRRIDSGHSSYYNFWTKGKVAAVAFVALSGSAMAFTALRNNDDELPVLPTRIPFETTVEHMASVRCPITDVEVVVEEVKKENHFNDADLGNLINSQLIYFPDCPHPATPTTIQS